MKNITVAIDDDLHRRARIRAAEQETSLSAVVKAFLLQYCAGETDWDRRKRLERETLASVSSFAAGDRLTREQVHERAIR